MRSRIETISRSRRSSICLDRSHNFLFPKEKKNRNGWSFVFRSDLRVLRPWLKANRSFFLFKRKEKTMRFIEDEHFSAKLRLIASFVFSFFFWKRKNKDKWSGLTTHCFLLRERSVQRTQQQLDRSQRKQELARTIFSWSTLFSFSSTRHIKEEKKKKERVIEDECACASCSFSSFSFLLLYKAVWEGENEPWEDSIDGCADAHDHKIGHQWVSFSWAWSRSRGP